MIRKTGKYAMLVAMVLAPMATYYAADSNGLVYDDQQRFSTETLPEFERLLGELSALSTSLRRLTEQTERNPASLLFGRPAAPAGPGESAPGSAPGSSTRSSTGKPQP